MLITVTEYAALIGKDPSAVRKKIIAGEIPAKKFGKTWVLESDTPYPSDRRIKSGSYIGFRKRSAED